MNRQQFLAEFNQYLTFFSPEERAKIISAYNEKFDSVGPEGEAALIAELGTPMTSAIDFKRRMEAGIKITIDTEREANVDASLSEYSVETETEESLNASDDSSEATSENTSEQPAEEFFDKAPEAPVNVAPKEESSCQHESVKPSQKINVFAFIGATLLSLVITAVFLAVAAVGVIMLVAMSYLLLTGLKNLLYITDALLLFGGGLVCAGLGLLIIWFAVSSAIGLISKLYRSVLRAGSDKECDA